MNQHISTEPLGEFLEFNFMLIAKGNILESLQGKQHQKFLTVPYSPLTRELAAVIECVSEIPEHQH